MKRFVLRSLVFIMTAFLVLNVLGYIIVNSTDLTGKDGRYKVFKAVIKSKRHIPGQVLFLGDSVGNQLFNKTRPDSLTVNGSILAAGHYILAYNAVKKNNHLKYIVLLSVPNVIANRFERSRTYKYFLKPFYCLENLHLFSKSLMQKINRKKIAHFAIFPFVKAAMCFSDVNFSGAAKGKMQEILSDIAVEYLHKLKKLCRQHHIKLVVASPPVPLDLKEFTSDWEKMREQVARCGLAHVFEGYFENIIYLDEAHFKDHIHVRKDYLKKNWKKIIKKILPKEVIRKIGY